jgi:hypothetical protein
MEGVVIYKLCKIINKNMAKINRQAGELQERLFQQIELLELANDNFDKGREVAALCIGTIIRVLLHDTNQSHSLFDQLGIKNINFLDTSHNNHPGTYLGLIIKFFSDVQDGQGGEVIYKPTFTSDFHFKNKNWIDFDSWWDKKILINENGDSLTRKQLVLFIANQEGGAHIDPQIDEVYDKFRHSYSGGVRVFGSKSGIERKFDNIPVLPSTRQISFEVIESLKNSGLL